MCGISGGHRFPNRLKITAASAGGQAGEEAPDVHHRRCACQLQTPATVNVSLAEIITVKLTLPSLPPTPPSRPVAPANFRATYSRLNSEISAHGGGRGGGGLTGGGDKGRRRSERGSRWGVSSSPVTQTVKLLWRRFEFRL